MPRVELIKPDTLYVKILLQVCKSGIIYGYIGQVEYIVNKMKSEMIDMGEEEPFVVATGGLSKLITKDSVVIDEFHPNLTLEGLRMIYEKNKE